MGVEGRYWNENVSARPNALRKKAETATSCRRPGPTRNKKRYTSSREEEDVATNVCPCGTTIESRTYIVGECEIYNKERDALEMTKLDVCDMEEFGRLESGEKTIAMLGDRWWPQTAKQDGDRTSKQFLCSTWKSAQMLELFLLRVGRVLRFERDAWAMVK